MDCPNCGEELPPTGKVCPTCFTARPPPPRSGWVGVLIMIGVISLILFAIDALTGDKPRSDASIADGGPAASSVPRDTDSVPTPLSPSVEIPNVQYLSFRVIGVARNDKLNVRTEPDGSSPIAGQLPPDAKDIHIIGLGVVVDKDTWVPVQTSEVSGWVNAAYLAGERQ